MQPVERFFQFSLLGLLASGYFAVLGSGFLDLPTAVLAGAGLLLRGLLVAGVVHYEFSPRWANAATLAYMGFYPLDYLYLSREFIPATVHLIFFLAVVRILTARTSRDYFFVKVLAFLELLAATLLSASMSFFVFLTLFVIFGVATFCCTEIRRSALSGRRVAATPARFSSRLAILTGSNTVGIVVMTAGLFFIFPRTARAAFASFVSQRYHVQGFANEITLGQLGEIRQESTPVMRVRIDSGYDRTSRLKWRGTALTQFDGTRWYNPASAPESIRIEDGSVWLVNSAEMRRRGKRLDYEVRINSIGSDVLFFAGEPELLQIGLPLVFRSTGDTFRTTFPSADGTHYGVRSRLPAPGEGSGVALSDQAVTHHLLLPPVDQRIIELARHVGQGGSNAERARAIEKYLRSGYGYTTELLDQPVKDPLAHFLFERRKGHCEYFASAMAVMLRAIHIPSRVATGFQSGVFNPMTGWHVIRASDAHSWVEAYLPGTGWTTFDPTPPSYSAATDRLWSSWALYADAAEMFWQQWVMNYNLEHQIFLASHVERSSRAFNTKWLQRLTAGIKSFGRDGWKSAEPYAAAGVLLVIIIAFAILCGPRCWKALLARRHVRRLSRGQIAASDAAILYSRMLDILRRRGYEKPAWLTPAEFARILPPSQMAVTVGSITSVYNDLRFARNKDAGVRLLELLKELETSTS